MSGARAAGLILVDLLGALMVVSFIFLLVLQMQPRVLGLLGRAQRSYARRTGALEWDAADLAEAECAARAWNAAAELLVCKKGRGDERSEMIFLIEQR